MSLTVIDAILMKWALVWCKGRILEGVAVIDQKSTPDRSVSWGGGENG